MADAGPPTGSIQLSWRVNGQTLPSGCPTGAMVRVISTYAPASAVSSPQAPCTAGTLVLAGLTEGAYVLRGELTLNGSLIATLDDIQTAVIAGQLNAPPAFDFLLGTDSDGGIVDGCFTTDGGIRGTRVSVYTSERGDSTEPIPTTQMVDAWVESDGGFTHFPGCARPNGEFHVPGVPERRHYLRATGPYRVQVNDRKQVELRFPVGTRALGAAPPPTTLRINTVSNLATWDSQTVNRYLDVVSPGIGLFDRTSALLPTAYSATAGPFNITLAHHLRPDLGDRVFVGQLLKLVDSGIPSGSLSYLARYCQLGGLMQLADGSTTGTCDMVEAPSVAATAAWRLASFRALEDGIGATYSGTTVTAFVGPVSTEGYGGASIDLVRFQTPSATDLILGGVPLLDHPFPGSRMRVKANAQYLKWLRGTGSAERTLGVSSAGVTRQPASLGDPIDAYLGGIQALTIDNSPSRDQPVSVSSLTPRVVWAAPAQSPGFPGVTPAYYRVNIQELETRGTETATLAGPVVDVIGATSFRVPPGFMEPGRRYRVTVTAYDCVLWGESTFAPSRPVSSCAFGSYSSVVAAVVDVLEPTKGIVHVQTTCTAGACSQGGNLRIALRDCGTGGQLIAENNDTYDVSSPYVGRNPPVTFTGVRPGPACVTAYLDVNGDGALGSGDVAPVGTAGSTLYQYPLDVAAGAPTTVNVVLPQLVP